MKITVLGAGCPTCESLYDRLKKLKEQKDIQADIEYKDDVNELVTRGIVGSPALLINDKPVYVGTPSDDELLDLVEQNK